MKIPRLEYFATNEHYALWEVIEFGNSYQAPTKEIGKGSASESFAKKTRRTVTITTEDMQKTRNDVKARTTLLLALPDEHQLRFSKLQAIVSHLEFMDVEIEQDDLNQKFLTSLAPEWLIYTIVWRNRDDLDKMLWMIGKSKVHTASVSTASTQVSTDRTEIKYEDITQIDEYDIEEMDIKWNMALLSMRADRFWKKTGKKITIQGSYVVGFDKSKGPKEEEQAPKALMAIDGIGWDWSYMANEEENHALVADEEVPIEFALMDKSSLSSENEDIMLYPPPAQVYSPHKKDMSWTGLPEFADDTVTDYSRPSPSIDSSKSNTSDLQNSNSSISEHGESESIMSKPMIKFVKAVDSPKVVKTNKTETARKSPVKYAEMAIPRITLMIKDIRIVVALST
uniref:Uncharacterized protein n=1 Tax=Tanacetum cinerariifolium TaxID=118510 RepID=A0A699I7Q4_TANCI|nr:hypothetical protein [Tanacetum cinerariifolium]